MSKASIVIPVYNKGRYLKKTLASVDKQTEDDIEVIIIDDSSTDNGLDIITDFANNTKKQVKIIKNDTNQGVAYSRNIGIEETKSDYITFLDADDILNTDFMEVMLNKAKEYPAVDFIRGIMRIIYEDSVVVDGKTSNYYENQIIVPKMNPSYIIRETCSSNGRLYKSEFVKNLKFVESSYEDYEFSLDTLLNCKSILYTTQAVYNYIYVENSKNNVESDKYLKTFEDYELIYNRILQKHPNITEDEHQCLRKKQIQLHINNLKRINDSEITPTDKMMLLENVIVYLKHQYGMSALDIFKFMGSPLCFDTSQNKAKEKIKEILIKY